MVDTDSTKNGKSNDDTPISKSNEYKGYADTLELYKRKAKDCPKGVRLKLQKSKFLMIQFVNPDTDKITVKSSGEQFDDAGIINAVDKCWKISQALTEFTVSGDFWNWYEETILKKVSMNNNVKTYREIFEQLENAYYNGKNKNTKRKRSRDIPNDVRSFNTFYLDCFNRFDDWNKTPSINGFKAAIDSLTLGTKTAKDANCVLRKIAVLSHDEKRIVEYLNTIDFTQTEFSKKQSIDYQTFKVWHETTRNKILNNPNQSQRDSGLAWLWVAAANVVYGFRPSEIFAAKNIDKSYTVDGVVFPAIIAPSNKTKLLYLSDKTANGCTTKTGSRVSLPMTTPNVWDELHLGEFVGLPNLISTNPSASQGSYRKFLSNHDCPVTQPYAFRHLANQLGEMNGIPQEIRARSLGHSVAVNDGVYKKRSNLQTSVDILTQHKKQPLSYGLAVAKMQSMGIDTSLNDVQLILKVIYQID